MKKLKNLSILLAQGLFILINSLFVLIPNSPSNSPYSYRDSGVFLYTGWRILNGEIPYIHIWDHKPPLIFYINALGLGLANNSVWGVWLIELVFLFIASFLGFLLLKKLFGVYAAVVTTFVWLLALVFVIQGGNLTTEYTLVFQFGVYYLFFKSHTTEKQNFHMVMIGLLGGLAFFTKQTVVGIWIAVVIYLLIIGIKQHKLKNFIKQLLLIIAGFATVSIIIIAYFYYHGALFEFWQSAFVYNFAYSLKKVSGLNARILGFLNISAITKTGIYHFSALGLLLLIFGYKRLEYRTLPILLVALISFPIELLLINSPGTTYPHYFMTILPTLSIFCGLLFKFVDDLIQNQKGYFLMNFLVLVITLSLILFGSLLDYRNNNRSLQARMNESAILYIVDRTEEDDYVLVWGAESMVNFYSQRVSPTRFVYQYPLYRESYVTEALVVEFLDDIIEKQPKLILNSYGKHAPIYNFPIESDEINTKINYIRSIYEVVDEVNGWQVLALMP